MTDAIEPVDLLIRKMLNPNELISRLGRSDKFVELCLYGSSVPVLSVLNDEHHINNVTIVVPVLMISCHVSE